MFVAELIAAHSAPGYLGLTFACMPAPVLPSVQQHQIVFCSAYVTPNAFTVNVCHLHTTLTSTCKPSPAFTAAQQTSHIHLSPVVYGLLTGCHLPVLSF